MFKKLWERCYAPTKEQQKIIEDLWNNGDAKTRMAIARFGGHLYAEGWKDYFLCCAIFTDRIVQRKTRFKRRQYEYV